MTSQYVLVIANFVLMYHAILCGSARLLQRCVTRWTRPCRKWRLAWHKINCLGVPFSVPELAFQGNWKSSYFPDTLQIQHVALVRPGSDLRHGLFTTGGTVDEAAWRFISMDRACQVQLLIEAAGTPELWPAEMARGLKQALGSPTFCWLSFQTLWDELLEEGSDFLE